MGNSRVPPVDGRATTISDSTCHGCTELMELDKALAYIAELEAKLADFEHGHEKLLERMVDKIHYVHELIGQRNAAEKKHRAAEKEIKTLRAQIRTSDQPVCDHCGQRHFAGEGSSRWCR